MKDTAFELRGYISNKENTLHGGATSRRFDSVEKLYDWLNEEINLRKSVVVIDRIVTLW